MFLRQPNHVSHLSVSVPVLVSHPQPLKKQLVSRSQPSGLFRTAFLGNFHLVQPCHGPSGDPNPNRGPRRKLVALRAHGAPAQPSPPRKGPNRNSPWQKLVSWFQNLGKEAKQLTPGRVLFNLAVFWVLLRVWPINGVQEQHVVQLPFSEFVQRVKQNEVSSVSIDGECCVKGAVHCQSCIHEERPRENERP
ncbi:hypothetical protein DUNSADRAFT_12937 [Dunaliella salina]|uniref:Peptidase M41 FtsH extracellular domain-containing protein n=1 Tax=Dunaliella salina TaxID=3046 RepID=A0ABQ7GAE4_DUNSA|nr:hypothetical protein DUNSADRAFT_12937 [Dunaliella salina]|eukprot:KAF5831581.1 hypothetical protein DUNSADRAFT_12937 [Dunaliella salina]